MVTSLALVTKYSDFPRASAWLKSSKITCEISIFFLPTPPMGTHERATYEQNVLKYVESGKINRVVTTKARATRPDMQADTSN